MPYKSARRLAVMAAALVPLAAHAQNLTPDAARILTDPNFLPLQGQVWGYTDYLHTWSNGDDFNSAGNKTSGFTLDTDDLTQFFGYGITDDLMIDGSIGYEPNSTRTANSATGSTSTSSSGFSNPTFGLTWRILDQAVSPVTFDVFGSYSPDTFSAKLATPDFGGTIASGSQEGALGAALAEETQFFTIRGSFAADLIGRRQQEDPAIPGDIAGSGHTNYVAALATQTRFTDQISLNANFTYTFETNETTTNVVKDVMSEYHPGNDAVLGLALNYQFVPNTVVGSLIYRHGFTDDSASIYSDPVFDTSVRNRDRDVVGVELNYLLP